MRHQRGDDVSLIARRRSWWPVKPADAGFTLVELVVTITLISIIIVPLSGVVIEFFKTTVATSARVNESHDIQFVAAYWQRDVSSIGVRNGTYDDADAVHTFPLKQSVSTNSTFASCAADPAFPSGSTVIVLGWSTFTLDASGKPSQTVTTATYVAALSATTNTYTLTRVLCDGPTITSHALVADHLTAVPTPTCTGGGVSGCADTSDSVPTKVTLALTSTDPNNNDGTTFQQTLIGERRQT